MPFFIIKRAPVITTYFKRNCLIAAASLILCHGKAAANELRAFDPAFKPALENYQKEHYNQAYDEFNNITSNQVLTAAEKILAETGAGASAYQNSRYTKALQHYKQAYKLFEKTGTDKQLKAELLCSLGDVCYEEEKYPQSINYFKQSLALAEEKDGSYDIFMRSLEGLAASYFNNKQIEEALPIYEEMAWRDRHTYGPLSVQYGWSLRVLADVYDALGVKEKAKICFDRSVWNFRSADRDRLLKELAGKSKYDNESLATKLTERTIGTRTRMPEPDNLEPRYTHKKAHLEPATTNADSVAAPELPWQRKRTVMQQPAGMQWINPDIETRGIVVCIPGFGLHRTSFAGLGQKLAQEGYSVYAYDVRGFGSNTTLKARDRIDLEKTMDDLKAAIGALRQDNPNLPIFVLGESMGGSIALQFTAANPDLVDGLVAAVPSSRRYRQFKLVSEIGLHKLFGNKDTIDAAPTVLNRATTNEALKQELMEDPESRMSATPDEFIAVSKFLAHNRESASKITQTPVMMYQGVHDLLIKPEGTISLFRRIGTLDKDLTLIGRSQHLLFEQDQFSNNLLNTLSDWLKNHAIAFQLSKKQAVKTAEKPEPVAKPVTAPVAEPVTEPINQASKLENQNTAKKGK